VINPFIVAKDVLAVEPAYERAILNEVAAICRAIPHRDLAIQWDICIEMVLWDGRWPLLSNPFADLRTEVISRIKALAAGVPEDVELGFHLCYGDWDAKHFIEPQDSGKLVELANLMVAAVTRPVTYIHMPVPVNRSDEAYFAPLSALTLPANTELYLGLVHDDGAEATRTRIRSAAIFRSDFGVATECGMARLRTPELVRTLLSIHSEVSAEPPPGFVA
jgi:methionine synthase II (cobalamin-independent)